MKKIALLLGVVALAGCATVMSMKLTPEQTAYVETVMKEPLEVYVAKQDIEAAWGRAGSFISKYASTKIQVSSDFVIETYNPVVEGFHYQYGYKATKTPVNQGFTIEVICVNVANQPSFKAAASRNAHIMAYYVKTGELPFPEMIGR